MVSKDDGDTKTKEQKVPEDSNNVLDIDDLIDSSNKNDSDSEMEKLNLSEDSESFLPTLPTSHRVSLFEFIMAYISLFVLNRPKLAGGIVFTFLFVLILVVNLTLKNDKSPSLADIVGHDYSSIKSKYDLNVGKIDHWCLQGGDQRCRCEDPLNPSKKNGYRNWEKAHQMNLELVTDAILGNFDDYDDYEEKEIDVVFLGENIVEAWAGRSVSFNSTFTSDVKKKFDSFFDKNLGGKFNGLPLGIAGDTTSNVLWRIQNGEIPFDLYPKVWWLVLGTNDLAMKQCSEEVVLLGILRVIEEITELRPDAKIVVSSILPMTTDKDGRVPVLKGKDQEKREQHSLDDDTRRALKTRDKTPAIQVRKSPFAWVRISLWPSVSAINAALKKFCAKHNHIVFFDAYDIFVDTATDDNIPAVKEDMVKSFALGQPSVTGHEELLRAINRRMTGFYKKWYGAD